MCQNMCMALGRKYEKDHLVEAVDLFRCTSPFNSVKFKTIFLGSYFKH